MTVKYVSQTVDILNVPSDELSVAMMANYKKYKKQKKEMKDESKAI
jgi:Mg2+/citrate symporter